MANNEFIFIDVETTGCRPTADRIIDLALYNVKDNQIAHTWQTLINPQCHIPSFIQNLTGIANSMVIDAPNFSEIALELMAMIDNKVFVAHNARFDYAFIKNALKAAGFSYSAKTLCTMKLSRHFYPQEKHHNLAAIKTRLQLPVSTAHRAAVDVASMYAFYQHLQQSHGEVLATTISSLIKQPTLPIHLPATLKQDIPTGSGIYKFYGDNQALIYIGKSVNLRERIFSHFSADHLSYKEMQLAQQVKQVTWIETNGELGALLMESTLIKQEMPIFNKKLRRHKRLFTLHLQKNEAGFNTVNIIDYADQEKNQSVYGFFRYQREAKGLLREFCKTYKLCPKLLHLEPAKHACFYYQLHQCLGACIAKEPPANYNARLQLALMEIGQQPWPYPGSIAIKEQALTRQTPDHYHLVNQWCYLGTVYDAAAIKPYLAQTRQKQFDVDIYKLLVRYLKLKTVPLDVIPLE